MIIIMMMMMMMMMMIIMMYKTLFLRNSLIWKEPNRVREDRSHTQFFW